MARSDKVMSPVFRVSFPYVLRPQQRDDREPKYSITALFKRDEDLSALREAAHQVRREEWKDNPPPNLRNPFKDQGLKAKYEGYEPGAIYLTATSKRRPGLVDANMQPIVDESEFYPGCYARATLVAFTYGGPGMTPGVGFWVQNIQKVRDGDPLGGGSRPEDDFEPVLVDATGVLREDDVPW